MIIPALDQVTIAALLDWVQMGGDIDGEAASDQSGISVSLSSDGTIVAIGAYTNDGAGGVNSGHVRVYQYDATKTTAETDQTSSDFGPVGWRRLGADIDGEAPSDYSGYSVSLSSDGTILAVGAHGNDDVGTQAGHVKVYEYSGGSWSQLGANIDGEAAYDYSGISVSLSDDGTIVAIGAYGNDGTGSGAGHVKVYEYSGSSWGQLGADIDGEAAYDQSGYSVSLSSDGSIVAIGAPSNDGIGTDAGHVRVYEYDATKTTAETDQTSSDFGPVGWRRLGADIDGEAADDFSGRSVSLSDDGSILAVGAYGNDGTGSSAGHVRVYEYSGSSWGQLGADIDGEATGDRSGFSVSLSSDGTIVAIGATYNDGSVGHVRVYEYSGSSWSQKGGDIDGEAANDDSGYSVSLSSDGSIVAIGAISNDGTGTDAGHVRVYQI